MMEFADIQSIPYDAFHGLLNEYYREGEDAQTAQEEIDAFIQHLFDLCCAGKISGAACLGDKPLGFVLWNMDEEDSAFSQKPGFGTILEIGVREDARGAGIGRKLVDFAESRMNSDRFYVCAYGPAQSFWSRCGYVHSGETAENGLPIMVKG